jgi:small GTP-binding protein
MERISTVDFKKRLVNLHDKEVALSIWDTVGQEKFRSIVATYLKSCHGILLVFDLGNELSWRNVQSTWSNLITSHAQGVPSLLIGNKNDVPSSINRQEIHSWCKQKGIYYIETCAKTGFQVSQTLNTLATFVDINNDPLWAS